MNDALEFLLGRPLFADLDAETVRHLAQLMVPFSVAAGETLFQEGQPSQHMYVIEHGRIAVTDRLPGDRELRMGELGPGGVIGEMALLRGIAHGATAVAIEPTDGFVIGRDAIGALTTRSDAASRRVAELIGRRATLVLRREIETLARSLGATGPGGDAMSVDAPAQVRRAAPDAGELEHLAGLPFFAGFDVEEVGAVVGPLERRWADRGAVLVAEGERPEGLLLVVHGAVEATLRGPGVAARVLLAGPGRCAGHLGTLDDGDSPVVCRARERCVVLVLGREHLQALRVSDLPLDRRLVRAIYDDVVGAVEQAQRPLARLAASGIDPGMLGTP